MKKSILPTEDLIKFEDEFKKMVDNPSVFFSNFLNSHKKEDLSSLLSYFLANSDDIKIIKASIAQIHILKINDNVEDIVDFLMARQFPDSFDKTEVINLKSLGIKALSALKDKRAIPALVYCLNNKTLNYKMRFQAAEALGKIGDKNAVESLINVVSDEEEKSVYVRESAAFALGVIGDMRAVDPFLNIMEAKKNFLDKFTFLKERVVEALGKMKIENTERVINVYKNALEDDSAQVRINAIECLMNSGAECAYDLIKEKLYDSDEEVVKNAVIAMYNLKGKDALFEVLKDGNLAQCAKNEADSIYQEYEEDEK